jgi:hypothetical protein
MIFSSKRHFDPDIPQVSQTLRGKFIYMYIEFIMKLHFIINITIYTKTFGFVAPQNCAFELQTIQKDIHITASFYLSSLLFEMFI